MLAFFLATALAVATTTAGGALRAFPEGSDKLPVKNGWREAGAPSADEFHEFIVVLEIRNSRALNDVLMAVSDPASDQYGKHLSLEQLAEIVSPNDQVLAQVEDWIVSSGAEIVGRVPTNDMITVRAKPAAAERMLATKLVRFEDATGRSLVRGVEPYSVPIELENHVSFVSNVHGFPTPAKKRVSTGLKSDPLIGPVQLRQRYNVTVVGAKSPKNSQAVAEFQSQFYSPTDLASFFAQYVPFSKNSTVYGVRPPGSNTPSAPGVEAELDIQYIMGVAPNVATYFYSQTSFDFWAGLTAWAALINADQNPPLVQSVSYGDQSGLSKPSAKYHQRLDMEFQKMGARGLSIIFASGDSGAGCDFCIWESPSFPATSPHVTSVGATRFIGGVVNGPEMAVNEFGSGGGFSWDFARPSYQDAAVASFFKQAGSSLPFSFQYNRNGRATPDVAALGIGFAVVVSGVTMSVGGTSASAPTFAAIVSLLNDARLAKGKSPLGFLNPWLYGPVASSTGALWDVTQGSNGDGCCFVGFDATQGYDPVTGLGTPNFKQLITLI